MKRLIIAFLIIGGIGGGIGYYYMHRGGGELQVNTLTISRGDIIDAVGSTGTLQAVTTVTVGSQVSGNISELDADFNSMVKKDQVIAKLDPTLLQAQVDQSQANLDKSKADDERMKVSLEDAKQKLSRAEGLAAKNLETQADLDAARIAVKTAEASLLSQDKTVIQAEATLHQNQVNVDHCIITAPIDGIITQRSVDVGQTVAASMSAPTLFVIAADLTKMQINASIDESDVGRIRPGQTVTFRVDAWPGQEFKGVVAQVRLQPAVVQNVTTYSTIISVPNDDYKLKLGMTANLKVQIDTRADAIRVPNAALRFRPTNEMFAALNQPVPPEAAGRGGAGRGGAGRGGAAGAGGARAGAAAPAAAGAAAAPGAAPAAPGAPGAAADASGGGRGRRNGGGQNADASGAGGGGRGGRGGGRGGPMTLDRFKQLPADQQKAQVDRMKTRGEDTKEFEAAMKGGPAVPAPKYGDAMSNATIDALFPPLPPVEGPGRVWVYGPDKQLKVVNLRLGITDGNQTELLEGSLEPGQDVVTGMVLPNKAAAGPATNGNPLLPGRGGPGGPGGGGRGPGR